jgi:CheY-like chemotaxis protein
VELEVNHPSFTILADPARLQQALMNMAINARDAMSNGGILRLSLSPFSVAPGVPPPVANMGVGNWLCIGVGDSGTGIPADVLPHIFDPFYTTKAPGTGTGLGLAQVYGIIHQLDGFINVESQVGLGTLFTIYFPLVDQPATVVDESQAPPPRGTGETVLLVEDESALREAMAETLTQLGYQVLTAANGRQAIALFGEHAATIKVVVSDLIMPDIGGKELYQALVQSDAHPDPLRMLLVTGYPRDESEEWHTDKGTHGTIRWLQKPFAMESFARRVAETLHAPSHSEP